MKKSTYRPPVMLHDQNGYQIENFFIFKGYSWEVWETTTNNRIIPPTINIHKHEYVLRRDILRFVEYLLTLNIKDWSLVVRDPIENKRVRELVFDFDKPRFLCKHYTSRFYPSTDNDLCDICLLNRYGNEVHNYLWGCTFTILWTNEDYTNFLSEGTIYYNYWYISKKNYHALYDI